MTVVNNSAPRTHPNDKLRYIPKSGMSRDHTRTGSRRSRCLGGVAEVRPCETGWVSACMYFLVLILEHADGSNKVNKQVKADFHLDRIVAFSFVSKSLVPL